MVAADELMVVADAGADVHPSGADVHPPGADTGAEAAADEPEGFPGGPTNPSVFIEYAEHVAASVCVGSSGLIIIKKGVELIIPKPLLIKNYSSKAFTKLLRE